MTEHVSVSHVRTVAGDVDVLGMHDVDAHDHLFLDLGCSVADRAELLLQSEDEAVDELEAYKDAGGGAVVCATPIGLGRRANGLLRATQKSGVTVLATGGFHKLAYYPPNHWVHHYPLTKVAELVYEEAALGIDRYDYAGPYIERTTVRPGLLKAGADFHRFVGREAELHRVVADVAGATGLPMILHVEHGADPHPALAAIDASGLELSRVLVSHLDRSPDVDLHTSVAARGAYLIYDGLYRERYRPVSAVLDVLESLVDRGHLSRVLIGGDLASRKLRRVAGAPGIAGLRTKLVPRVQSRFGDEVVNALVTANPRRALALGPLKQ